MSNTFQPNLDFEAATTAAEDGEALIIDLDGYEGPLHVLLALARSQKVDLMKLSITRLADTELAEILSFVRISWGNGAPTVDAGTVAKMRAEPNSPYHKHRHHQAAAPAARPGPPRHHRGAKRKGRRPRNIDNADVAHSHADKPQHRRRGP